jgi:hypothetical protein
LILDNLRPSKTDVTCALADKRGAEKCGKDAIAQAGANRAEGVLRKSS